jgi:capsid protein
VKWVPPKFEFINPIDDVKADILAIRAGLKSWKDVVSSYGYDPDEVLDEIAAVNLLLDDFGIILDSDPRYTTQQGLAQMSSDVGDGEADPEEGDKPTEGKKPAAAAKPAAKTTPKKAPAKKPAAKQKVAA